ncbi:MAG: GNAT family N-acetyltransferase [Erysipelotrichaceae bacterium]|nr:GNAT family N-acetyltransferase [Erysipelotrichaceae bacterium]
MTDLEIRPYRKQDCRQAIQIWNEVVEEGNAFPQEERLDEETGHRFFSQQSYTGLAFDSNGKAVGLYILHPNNVGRCAHICNASYAVDAKARNQHIGKALVCDCLKKAKELHFSILQFNAVVADNHAALHLYRSLGFHPLGRIPKGFRKKEGVYEDIIPHYIEL